MELEFFGAAGEVTGSCHLLRIGSHRVLLDCGMIQGGRQAEARNRDPFPFHADAIDAVVLSHAHIDHSGRLPLLVKRGFRGPVHTQNASRDLARILLADAAHLEEMDTERENRRRERKGVGRIKPLFTAQDAAEAMAALRGHRYHQPFEVVPGMTVTFLDAGHILGSAVVQVDLEDSGCSRRLVFSGDLGQYDTPILRDPESPERADLVLMESTYGNRRHRGREQTIEEIGEVIRQAAADRGNILIPAFAVGRSQELLYQLGRHYREWGLDRWRIFLDSPLAIEASEIYWNYPNLFDEQARKLAGQGDMPPLPNLELSHSTDQSMAINRIRSGALIIAGSGMCNGGRITHHLKHNAWRRECHVLIVGYQAEGTVGRRLVDGHDYIRIHGEAIRVAARVHTVGGLSAHGDQADLTRWYDGIADQPPVWLVHGEPEATEAFARHLGMGRASAPRIAKPGVRLDLASLGPSRGTAKAS